MEIKGVNEYFQKKWLVVGKRKLETDFISWQESRTKMG